MYPTIVDFGPFGIHSFGLMLATAFITCVFVIQSELKRRGFIPELASTIVMAAAIGGLSVRRFILYFSTVTSLSGNSSQRLDWSGMVVSSLGVSVLPLWLSALRTHPYPHLTALGPRSSSVTESAESGVSSLATATMDRRPMYRGRWRFRTAPSRPMSLFTPPLYMRRSCRGRFSVSSGPNGVNLRQRRV